MSSTEILLQENIGVPLGTPAIPFVEVNTEAATPNLTTHNLTSATAGVIDIKDSWLQGSERKKWPINVAVLQFAKVGSAAASAGNIAVYAGRDDGQDLKLVCKAALVIGTRFKGTGKRYIHSITLDGAEDWGRRGVQVQGNNNNDIAQVAFDLRGCDKLFIACDDADTEVWLSGY